MSQQLNLIQQLPFMDMSHLEKVLENEPDAINVKYDGKSVLHHAIITGNLAIVEAVLQKGGFSDDSDPAGQTPLLAACKTGQLWTVDQLIRAGGDPEVKDVRGTSCVHAAAAAGRLTVLQYLREVAGLPLSAADAEGRTPLMLAAAAGHADSLIYLLAEARPSVAARDARGDTALHHAARAGQAHVCWLLLTSGGGQLHSVANAEGQLPHQTADPKLGAFLRSAGGSPGWPRRVWTLQLLRPALTALLMLASCALLPPPLKPILSPVIMLAAAYSLRRQSHRLNHPSRYPSPFAVGCVCALVAAGVGAAELDMRSRRLLPAPVVALSALLVVALLLMYRAALTEDPGPAPPADDLPTTLRRLASTKTGQLAYCAICRHVWRSGWQRHHCRLCGRCYPGYDHHCLYLNTCVTSANRRVYLQFLLLAALCCVVYLCHVAALVCSLPAGSRAASLLGRHVWTGSVAAAAVAALLLLRSLLVMELGCLWSAMEGGRWRRLRRLLRYVTGRAHIRTDGDQATEGLV